MAQLLLVIAGYFKLLKTKRNLLYIRNQSVPRSKAKVAVFSDSLTKNRKANIM